MKSHASLNRSFRLVRRADAQVVPVPETARGHGARRSRSAGTTVASAVLTAALLPVAAWAAPPAATQLPAGGSLAAGQASWQSSGATLTVNQSSQRAVIDWQSFNLGSQASVVFNQAAGRSGATLNRVLDSQPSQILGRIQAPGQVFISNPSGVIFGSSASVDVGGLVATSMSMSTADFMAGGSTWQRNGSTAAVVNAGALTAADGGYIALLAPEVRNEGVIVARAGAVVLAAGEAVRLEFADTRLGSVQVSAAELKTLVENRHAILAPEGLVVLSARSADALRSGVVNQAGVIDAGSLVSRGGRVLLEGDAITLAAGSRINASGATGGGSVLVGGDWQGSGTMHQATQVAMESGASIDASATQQGQGGKVVLWSDTSRADGKTTAQGRIAARGGALGGDGGQVETSGHSVALSGLAADASAPQGKGGQWLIDPTNLTIGATDAATYNTALQGGTDVTVQTASTGSEAGDITVASQLAWTSNASLTLSAANDIVVNAPITLSGSSAKLTLEYGQGAVASGNTSTYNVYAPISLAAGPNFITKLGSDGTAVVHTVITGLGSASSSNDGTLQGVGGSLAGNFVLGADIDASGTSSWNSGQGFTPIGATGSPFTGSFDGLGHVISGLSITRPSTSDVALFGRLGSAGSIRNVGVDSAAISGYEQVGGLVGASDGAISDSFSTGTVTGYRIIGGLVGNNGGSITNAYSGAQVSASGNYAGGLTANNGGPISYSYATGNVSGSYWVGGLVGYQNAATGSSLSNSYASGTASGSTSIGSLVGYSDSGATITNSAGGVSAVTASTFSGWDFTNHWTIYDGVTTPLLSAFLKPVTVTAPTSKTYDRTLYPDFALVTLSTDASAWADLYGLLQYGGGATSSAAGTYSAVTLGGLYSHQRGYRISYAPVGTLTIDKAVLTVSGNVAANKVYDGTSTATVSGSSLDGVVTGDSVALSSAGASFADANVGTAKTVTPGFTLSGTDAANYVLTQPTGLTADITQLASVAWTGGTSGDWFTASNWAGGAVPTLANVANVTIPTGVVASLANSTSSNAPVLTSLTGAGGVQLSQASLGTTGAVNLGSVNLGSGAALQAGSLSTGQYTQSGGSLAVTGALNVAGSFTQTGGTIRAGGTASVAQASGDLYVTHLVANGLTLNAAQGDLGFANLGSVGDASLSASGNVTQASGGSLTVLGAAAVVAGGNVAIDQARNMVVGSISVQGQDVRLMQGLDDLVLGTVSATGNLTLNATSGHIRQADATAISVGGTTSATAPKGSIYLTSSDNAFGGAVSAAAADIAITQGASALVLGDVAASANLAIVSGGASGGAVTQTGTLTVAGKTSVDGGANSVVLDRETNDFTGAVAVKSGALTLVDGVGGLSLGNVQTSGATLVNSLDGTIVQNGSVFVTTSPTTASFNAWKDGAYTSVGVNTSAAVLVNGQLLGSATAAAVSGGMASALGGLASRATGTASADPAKGRRADGTVSIPQAVPMLEE